MLSPIHQILMIHLLENNHFTGYGQRHYKISLTHLSNTGITMYKIHPQAQPQGMGLLFLLHLQFN